MSFRLPGEHNVANALAASVAALWLGVPACGIARTLADFQPLEHRLEFVAAINGLSFYDDSIATTPESAVAAINSFRPSRCPAVPITLIAGGYDKHIELDAVAEEIALKVSVLVLIGQTGPRIRELVLRAVEAHSVSAPHIVGVQSMNDAVECAYAQSLPGAVVMLSPACASYDMFENYAQRGDLFKEAVRELAVKVA